MNTLSALDVRLTALEKKVEALTTAKKTLEIIHTTQTPPPLPLPVVVPTPPSPPSSPKFPDLTPPQRHNEKPKRTYKPRAKKCAPVAE